MTPTKARLWQVARPIAVLLATLAAPPRAGAQPAPAQAPAGSPEHHAANLGITYRLIPYGNAFGARLTRDPDPGSPAAQVRFEPGDMIVSLDGQAITRPEDVLAHVDRTTLVFINVRTNQAMSTAVTLPHEVVGGGLRPAANVQPPRGGGQGRITQPELRRIVAEDLRSGHVPYKPPVFRENGRFLDWKLGQPDLGIEPISPAVYAQFDVEIIRLTRTQPRQREFWEPYLQRIERVVAELLAQGPAVGTERVKPGTKPDEEPEIEVTEFPGRDDERISKIFEEAMQANAATVGKTARPIPPTPERGIYAVTLATPSGQGRVYIMPRTPYRIRAVQPVSLTDFQEHPAGATAMLSGEYVYFVRYGDGPKVLAPHTPLPSFRVDRGGTIPVR